MVAHRLATSRAGIDAMCITDTSIPEVSNCRTRQGRANLLSGRGLVGEPPSQSDAASPSIAVARLAPHRACAVVVRAAVCGGYSCSGLGLSWRFGAERLLAG
eukprot:15368171-Alexandrium_andersonii.AAC.1